MKYIKLTQGKHALVDDADFEWLNQWKWHLLQGRYAESGGRGGRIRMHRLIMDAPQDKEVDHINHDGLDNRRVNLRVCSHSENTKNMKLSKASKTGYKNIYRDRTREKWAVQIMSDGRKVAGGRFEFLEDAINCRNKLVKELHGEYANV